MIRRLLLIGLAFLVLADWATAAERGPVRRIDRECRFECHQQARECLQAARLDGRMCRQECGPLLGEARATCAEDSGSDACAAARALADECLQACRRAFYEAAKECHAAGRACLSDCPEAEPAPPKDPECIAVCRDELMACRSEEREQAADCIAACGDLRAEAREACSSDRTSDECAAARRALHECVEPCHTGYREGIRACTGAARDCAADCPDVDPAESGV